MHPLLLKGLVLVALFLGGLVLGIRLEADHRDAQLLAQERGYIAQYKSQVQRAQRLGARLEGTLGANRALQSRLGEALSEVGQRPVYAAECIDDDGLRIINDALGAGSASGKRDAAVLSADPVAGQDGQGAGREAGGSGGAVR